MAASNGTPRPVQSRKGGPPIPEEEKEAHMRWWRLPGRLRLYRRNKCLVHSISGYPTRVCAHCAVLPCAHPACTGGKVVTLQRTHGPAFAHTSAVMPVAAMFLGTSSLTTSRKPRHRLSPPDRCGGQHPLCHCGGGCVRSGCHQEGAREPPGIDHAA